MNKQLDFSFIVMFRLTDYNRHLVHHTPYLAPTLFQCQTKSNIQIYATFDILYVNVTGNIR